MKLLQSELGQNHYRLIGISGTDLQPEQEADAADLIAKEELTRTTKLESAMSQIRAKAGDGAIYKGRAISLKNLNPKT